MSNILRTIFRRRAGKTAQTDVQGTYVMEAQWERSEELRPERLGPSQDDIDLVQDPWRPRRSLGPLPKI